MGYNIELSIPFKYFNNFTTIKSNIMEQSKKNNCELFFEDFATTSKKKILCFIFHFQILFFFTSILCKNKFSEQRKKKNRWQCFCFYFSNSTHFSTPPLPAELLVFGCFWFHFTATTREIELRTVASASVLPHRAAHRCLSPRSCSRGGWGAMRVQLLVV